MRGGGAGSRRASGLAGALGSGGPGGAGRRRPRAGPGAPGLKFPPPGRVGKGRRALKSGEGRCGPRCSCGDRVPVRGPALAVGQRLAGQTVLFQGLVSGRSAAAGPFPATSRACPRHSDSESFPIAFLHVCVSCGDWVRKFGGVLTNSTVTDAGG